jgi:nitric oxide dioxygenase
VLHNSVEVGDIIEISNPYGEITLKDGDGPPLLSGRNSRTDDGGPAP